MHIINPLPHPDHRQVNEFGVWLVPGRNDDSGFRWGPFNLRGSRPWPLQIEAQGGAVIYPYRDSNKRKHSHGPRAVDPRLPIIMKGNFFEDFTHIRQFENSEVYYWDNCLLPQFMYQNPVNPRGSKVWCRLVRGSTAPAAYTVSEPDLNDEESRVNDWCLRESQGRIKSWREICPVHRQVRPRGRRVLFCLSQTQTLAHYYGEARAEIQQQIQTICNTQGWELSIRDKRDRRSREQNSLRDQLLTEEFVCAICTHSAAALEILATGTPVVALGANVAHQLSTTWQEFREGHIRSVDDAEVDDQMRRTLTTVFHKQELLSGSWSSINIDKYYEPYREWRLIKDKL